MDNSSLAHTTWTCKYHIVFAPKYRRKIIYKQIREDIIHIFKELCKRKGIEIIAGECCPDHVHMLLSIPPKYSVSEVMGYLKGKSSLMIFERHANLKYKYGNRHFWCRGYYVDTVGKMRRRQRSMSEINSRKIWNTIKCHSRSIQTRLRVSRQKRHKRRPPRRGPARGNYAVGRSSMALQSRLVPIRYNILRKFIQPEPGG